MKKECFNQILLENIGRLKCVLIFGPPGSGKGTLGRLLAAGGNHYHLSSGDIFRGFCPDSSLGKLFHKFSAKGELVPDEVTIEIWLRHVKGLIATNAYFPHKQLLLLDGLPRTLLQSKFIQPHIEVIQVIFLEMLDIEKLISRLRLRASKEGRDDDFQEKILKKRMQIYQEQTIKLLDYYPKELVSKFNANQLPLEVLRDVLVKLSYLLTHK